MVIKSRPSAGNDPKHKGLRVERDDYDTSVLMFREPSRIKIICPEARSHSAAVVFSLLSSKTAARCSFSKGDSGER